MTVRAIWNVVRFHWIVLLLALVLGAVVGAGVAQTREREYTARAEVFVVVSNGQDVSSIAQGATYAVQQARNFAAVASRQLVLQPVVDELNLDLTIGQLRSKVATNVPLNTSIISISATDGDPDRASDIANAVAVSLSDEVNRISPSADNGSRPVKVQSVERAVPPSVPSAPRVGLLITLFALLGLALALFALSVYDFLRAKVRDALQATQITGAPVIGTLARTRDAQRHPMALPAEDHRRRAEQYRTIRTNLRFLQLDHGNKVFVVTSAAAGEGKSTTAANIAAALAAAGTSVCLVEGDLRRPTLASILNLEGGVGLTTVVSQDVDLDDVLQPWGPDGLQVLLAGETPPNPTELLESRRAQQVLAAVRDRFQVTIIDSPPVLPVTDATILARQFGGALMVVSERQVEVRDLRAAVDRMSLVDAPILGTVMTMSRSARKSSPYYETSAKRRTSTPRHTAAHDEVLQDQ